MDFSFMNDLGKKLVETTAARQAEQQRAAAVTQVAKQNAANITRETATVVAPIEQGVLERAAATQHARELRDSGKVTDRLELITRTLLQPGLYDSDTRAKRDAQDANALSLLGATQSVKLSAVESQLRAATTGLDSAVVNESIALEQFKAIATQQDLQTGNIVAAERLKQITIDSLTKDELAASIENAVRQGQDSANVNGIDIPIDRLIEQNNAIIDREFARQAAVDATTPQQKELAQERVLNTMSVEQLTELFSSSGVTINGEEFNVNAVETALNSRKRAEAERLNAQLTKFNVENVLPQALTSASERVNRLEANTAGNAQLGAAVRQSKLAFGRANAALNAGDPVLAATLLDGAERETAAAIADAAKRESLGNPQVEQLLNDFYSTGQVNSAQAVAIGADALIKGKSLVSVFPPAFAQTAQTAFNEERNILLSEATASSLGQRLSADERKSIDEQAAQAAILRAANQTGLEIHNFAIQNQVNAPGHPFNGRISPERFASLNAVAKQRALQTVAAQLDTTPEDVRGMITTGVIPDKLTDRVGSVDELRSSLNFAAALARDEELGETDSKRLLDWYESQGATYADSVAGSFPRGSTGVQNSVALTLSADVAKQQWFEHVAITAAANSERARAIEEKSRELIEGSDLFKNEAMVLGNMFNLSDTDKRLIWPSLRSVIADVAQLKLDPKAARQEFIKRVGRLKFNDAAATRAIRLFSTSHEDFIGMLEGTGFGMTVLRSFDMRKIDPTRPFGLPAPFGGSGSGNGADRRFDFLNSE